MSIAPFGIPRRRFIYSSGLALGGTLLTGCRTTTRRSPNEKLNIGLIGVGNKGAANLTGVSSENIVALCDVDSQFLGAAVKKYPRARQYRDWRKMLVQRDIDAVVVTVPDHSHAIASMAAIKLAKHVYCEKPLTHDVWEARQLTQAARQYKVATQMGNSGHSSESIRQCVEWIRAGVIGPVREVHTWTNRPIWPQGLSRPADTPPVPASVDWDLWVGPAPLRPYHPAYHPFKWRGWWDFGTGALGDMGCHIIDAAFWALELGAPLRVEAESFGGNSETAPSWSIVRYEFPARRDRPPVKLTWSDGGKQPSRDLTELAPDQKLGDNGSLFVGEKGKLLFAMRELRLVPQTPPDFKPPPKTLRRSIGHYKEWIEACKGNGQAGSNFDYAGPLTEAVLLGNIALRTGRKIEWDSKNLRATNSPEAAQYIRREYRSGWSL